MHPHWLSSFALIAVAAFAGGALFSNAIADMPTSWLVAAVVLGFAAGAGIRWLQQRRRR